MTGDQITWSWLAPAHGTGRPEMRIDYVKRRLDELGVTDGRVGWSKSRDGELQVLIGPEVFPIRIGQRTSQKAIDEQLAKIEAAIRRARA